MLFLVFSNAPMLAEIAVSKAYRIIPVSAPNSSLITKNSSLDSDADVVVWAETDVASQQWVVTGTLPETVTFRNGYTKMPLGVSSTGLGGKARQIGTGGLGGRWALEAVDESANIYKLQQKATGYYLSVTSVEDGALPELSEAADGEAQLWKFVEVELKSSFTAAMREEMMDAYIRKALESVGSNRKTFGKGGWSESEQLEILLDAYETTGRDEYLTMAKNVYSYFSSNVGSSWDKLVYNDNYHWFGHDFNDDVMWQIIAVARLGLLSGGNNPNNSYIRAAKKNFDIIYERAYIPFTGLMRWAQSSGDAYGTNSCIAGPTEVAACYLGFAGCGEEYFEKARDLYAAQRYALANNMSTGKIWDNVVWDPSTKKVKGKNEWASTYNQGTMLGAACMLYKYYGDTKYLNDAKKIMSWTRSNLCDKHYIINVCQGGDNADLYGFKGILMRYVRRFVRDCDQKTYQKWMEDNAFHAYCNRSAEGVTPTGWLQKGTAQNTENDFAISTAASAAVNVIFPDDPPLSYEEKPLDDGISQPTAQALTSGGPVVYYDLTGRRLSQIQKHGTYIARRGAQSQVIHNI